MKYLAQLPVIALLGACLLSTSCQEALVLEPGLPCDDHVDCPMDADCRCSDDARLLTATFAFSRGSWSRGRIVWTYALGGKVERVDEEYWQSEMNGTYTYRSTTWLEHASQGLLVDRSSDSGADGRIDYHETWTYGDDLQVIRYLVDTGGDGEFDRDCFLESCYSACVDEADPFCVPHDGCASRCEQREPEILDLEE